MKRGLFIDILKGVGLFVLLWLVNVVIAFLIFNRESNTRLVILTWFIVDFLIYVKLYKRKFVNKLVNISVLVVIIILSVLYFVPISPALSQEALDFNEEISDKNIDRYQYAKELFFETEKKWTGPVREYLLQPHKVFFVKSSKFFWNVDGYVPSNIQAEIYRNLLLESGRFTENEVIFEQGFCSNSPHGYISIKHPNQTIYVDHWAVDNFPRKGISEIYKFGQVAKRPCDKLFGKGFE